MDINQQSRFSKGELEISKVFKSEELLYQVRNVSYQFPVSEFSVPEEALKVIKKVMLPSLTPDVPFGQQADNYLTIKLGELMPEMSLLQVKSRDLANQYLQERFEVLWSGKEKEGINLVELKLVTGVEDTERYIRLAAYFFLMSYIDGMMLQLKSLANLEDLTPKQKEERAKKMSSK